MHPTALVRAVQTERWDRRVEVLAGRGHHHAASSCDDGGDLPGAAHELHRLASVVLDLHAVGPHEVAVVRLRLILKVEGSDRDANAAGGLGVIFRHGTTGFAS